MFLQHHELSWPMDHEYFAQAAAIYSDYDRLERYGAPAYCLPNSCLACVNEAGAICSLVRERQHVHQVDHSVAVSLI